MIKQVESRQVTEKVRVSDWERKIISLREQGELKNRWLDYRINHVLPEIRIVKTLTCGSLSPENTMKIRSLCPFYPHR